MLEPQQILDVRWVKRGAIFSEEYLILWKHLSKEDATWEPKNMLLQNFPSLELEDKHPLDESKEDDNEQGKDRAIGNRARRSVRWNAENGSHNNYNREGSCRTSRDNGDNNRPFLSKIAKLEFLRFSGDDPSEWINRGEANQWWQWLRKSFDEERGPITWEIFEDEIRARFGPPNSEDFDEALSRVKQMGLLRDYQREFEKLKNRVRGWTQKALVGTFIGGLKPEVADGIRMFKPQSVKEAINLAKMRDDQLTRQ
ncbi:hypothetical protein Pint_32978 [Pistacia integerrima]|uniref:Uncharacterized protein n=1 Tax=Pistacia integerrima TaxID=434235 RepID=A0ACC0X5F0_9ROSI|nr:hypothetical protein Pint_32978 [Pistacia integerrima]